MSRITKHKMKASVLETATVFCISNNGVMEGHHFLTLVTCRPTVLTRNTSLRQFRARTFSLPPSLEDLHLGDGEGNPSEFLKLSQSGRSLSDDVFRISRRQQAQHKHQKMTCIDCMSGLKLCEWEKVDRKSGLRTKAMRKCASTRVGSSTRVRISLASKSKSKMHKSLVSSRRLERFGSACCAASAKMDGYMLSYFIAELRRSQTFRSMFLRHWTNIEIINCINKSY